MKVLSVVLIAGLCAAPAWAAQDDEAELLDLLAEETDLATRTLQNSDYVPGIVSVLHGEELAALGARTVLDALALVPGIEVLRDNGGNATLRVRGVDFFFNSGNVKVLIDSLDVGAETSALNSGILLMPVAQVQRIEVIRGPGSSLHGAYAFTGLVNIITRQERGRITTAYADGGQRGLSFSAGNDAQDWSIGGNLSATLSDRFDASGRDPADERRRYANAHLDRGGLSLKASIYDRDQVRAGPPPMPGQMPPAGGQMMGMQQRRAETIQAYEARFDHELGADRRLGIALGLQDVDSADGQNGYSGTQTELSIDGIWRLRSHLLVFEALVAQNDIDRASLTAAQGAPANQNIPPRGDRRQSRALTLQDQFDLSPSITLTGGLRYDALEAVDARVTPRLAVVWRVNSSHTIKAQYAEGFRTPTFVELFSAGPGVNGNLDFEAIATSEIGYLYRHENRSFRATLFNSEVDNLILRKQAPEIGHANLGALRSRGVELEYNQSFGEQWRLLSTLSFADTSDTRGAPRDERVASFGEPKELANLGLIYAPSPDWSFGAHWNHVGKRANPGSPDFPGYDQVDLAFSHAFAGGPQLRLGLRNAFGDEVIYVSRVPPGRVQLNDFSERQWSAEVVWDW